VTKKTRAKGVNTPGKQLPSEMEKFKWQPGASPNPKGRPKGSRNKLGEEFLSDMLAVWNERGKEAIEATAKDHPDRFVSIVASILPKELNVNTNPTDKMSDEDLERAIAGLESFLRSAGIDTSSLGQGDATKH